MMPSPHGRFVWYELMTSDTKSAETFYRSVLGWGARDSGVPNVSYTLLTVGETPVSGLMEIPERAREAGARPGWIGYVWVDDVDASAAKVKQEGGTIHHGPDDIPGVGRFAVAGDPQGAAFALFKASGGGEGPPASRDTPGHPGWRELLATDREAAFSFYAKMLGWTKAEAHDMGPMGVYQIFAVSGETIGGMMTKPQAVPAPFWLYYFNVESINAAVSRVQEGGGQILNGPMEVPGGQWIIQGRDPQGAMFALVGPRG
jgi:predicted enzyme related to lactoylglutathione lyase